MVGLIGAGATLAGGLMGAFGGSNPVPQAPTNPISPWPGVNTLTGGGPQGISSLSGYNLGGQYLPGYEQGLSELLGGYGTYGPGAQGAANVFAPAGMVNAGMGLGNAATLGGTINPLITQAFDPRSALFKQTSSDVSQNELAQLTNAGIATTPWGAGAYGQVMSNFDIGWQNQQLNRMLQGVQGAGGAATNAYNLGAGAAQGGAAAGLMPFQTAGTVGQAPLSALSGASTYGQGAAQVPQTGISDWLQYLGASTGGQNAATNLYNAQLGAQQQQFGQSQAFGRGIGAGLGGMPSWMSPYYYGGSVPFYGGGGGTYGYAGGGPGYFGSYGGIGGGLGGLV